MLHVNALLLDVQGTLTTRSQTGATVLIGGIKLIEEARKRNIKVLVLTNATKRNEDILKELRGVGLPIMEDEVLSAGQATGIYLREKVGSARVWILGEPSLADELQKYGHIVVNDEAGKPDFVVVGLDRDLTYEKLNKALAFLRAGAELIACHTSKRIPEQGREVISVGPIVKALEYASDRKAVVIGKPSRIMYEMALKKLGVDAHTAAMVSDEYFNDLAPAKELGIKTILTLTGVTKEEDVDKIEPKPDIIVQKVDDVVNYLS
ncbi:MAG: HAD-IIA family hydrolase [Candidatus Caldarchaeum sp.]|uniref:HAD-IIA family hydrolase n=1 Tax=Caldiarchaeum subterraneum TaxID=311458 RepID=A0A7C5Q543_CALS0